MGEELYDEEPFDDDDAWDEDEPTDVVECPHCGAEVYEDAEQCPACGDYIVHRSHTFSGKPVWYVLLALAGIAAVILLLSGLLR